MRLILIYTIIALLTACGTPTAKRITLAEVDINSAPVSTDDKPSISKSNDDIRQAYASYLEHASKNDKSRVDALSRLAALEFELSEQMLKNKNDQNSDAVEQATDNLYNAKLNRTIELLSTALRDYPDNENNDKTLYQLAKAYDQQGDSDNSHASLEKLAAKYPKSKYFIESQFRLAENAFSNRDYALAEDRYTDVIGAKKQRVFYEKSLYKRGWSRFKQAFYFEALDDFFQAVKLNAFDEYPTLSDSEKALFNEYFRAIGLSFSYMDGAESVQYHFKENPDYKHLYPIYRHLSNIYLREERNSDAVTTLEYFAKSNPTSAHVPEALLKVIDIWKSAGFSSRMNRALETFYASYHPGSEYWEQRKESDPRIFKKVKNSLRQHILTITASYHNQYLKTGKRSDYTNSKRWYENYLEHYSSYSRKDNIHFLYASLLASNREETDALKHYELAAYDANIIIDKNSAYESILLASKLSATEKNSDNKLLLIEKLIHFSTLYGQQYPNDKRTTNIILHASELAYENELFKQAIMLTELVAGEIERSIAIKINTIKGHAYFKLAQYEDAENIYHSILKDYSPTWRSDSDIINGLALAIYYQGESASKRDEIRSALRHYSRISQVVPTAKMAATGMYDAILLAMQKELWNEAIQYAKTFQRLYPHHKDAYDVTKTLTAAYLNSKQDIAAAKELEKLASKPQDRAYRQAALWKAGELYESNKEYPSAIRSFENYAKNFRRPFPQYMESMFKLVTLYKLSSNSKKVNQWQNSIVQEDKKVSNSLRTERTRLVASSAALHLARESHIEYSNTKLRLPLKKSLRKKRAAMQQAINLYGRASSYNVAETVTEATHSIAEIYNEFSIALLESEQPDNLNADELEQYQILIEDQAFPFEEKAIEFYEINLSYVKDDIYDQWIQKSHTQLKKLFPVRYQREARLEEYINVLH